MIKTLIKNIIVSLILFFPGFLLPQNHSFRFNNLSVEHGLSQNMIRSILQDSKGFMWFATWDGLNRYDGYEFKVYKNINNDSTSLRINKIRTIIEDHNKVLWVGTFGGGLSRFNPDKENFTNFFHDKKDKQSICSDRVLTILEDSHNRIWIGTENEGLSVIDNSKSTPPSDDVNKIKFINISHNPKDSTSISDNGVQVIYEDSFGNIWFGTSDGVLNKLEPGNNLFGDFKFSRFHSGWKTGGSKINLWADYVAEDKNYPGLFWLENYYQGLMWFDSKSGEFFDQYPHSKMNPDFPIHDVESFFLDNEGKFWFGTSADGIYTFKPEKNSSSFNSFEHFPLNPSEPNGISVPNITNFYQDKSGILWIGTNTNGLYTFNERTNRFINYFNNPLNENFLSGKDALSVLETDDGNIWIGTESGLDSYNPVTKKFTHYKNNPNNPQSLSSNLVYSLHQDVSGTLWIGTSAGLDKYNPSTNSFFHYKNDPIDSTSISAGEIIKIFSDSKGSLWVGSWKGGLNKLVPGINGKRDKFLHYMFDKNNSYSISDNRIMSIVEDKSGSLWIGTSEAGLNKLISDYSIKEDGSVLSPEFRRYQNNPDDANSLSNNDVRTLLIDNKGFLWAGTFGGGINKFIPENEHDPAKFIHYNQTNGLANDVVRGLLEDETGNLWIGTAHGLSKFNPDTKAFENFFESDGLQTSKFEDVSCKSKRNGMMYFGGVNGVVAFKPVEIKINPYQPQIVITSFKRYNTGGKDGITIKEKGISEKKEIVLSYEDNILTFEFAALSFYNSMKNSYAYKLEGYNENWIQLGNKRDVTFTNLDPGEYTLFVKGANSDGVWNEEGLSLKTIITPPWWRSNLAYAIYFISVLFGIFLTDRFMRRKVIQKERDKAKLREAEIVKRQADELETVDRLVRVINSAEDLDILFNSLLTQTQSFIPQAEKSAIFLLSHIDNKFYVAFTSGYEISDLEKITFLPSELNKRYTENSEEIEKGIYIIKNTFNLFGDEKLSGINKPMSMLVMAVEWDNRLEAYVVFDNFTKTNAFNPSAARILNRFREHAVSAISKAQSLKTLQAKNEEIIKTQEQLVIQEKLASLGALIAGIAHEIKNPLNFVNNFADLSTELLEELTETIESEKNNLSAEKYLQVQEIIETLKDNTKKINTHGSRADSIIKGMLLHSRGSSGEKTLVDINELLDQYVNLAYHGLRAQNKDFNITIEKNYDTTIEKMNVIAQDISRVFLNVINNACYAANERKKKSGVDFVPRLKVSTNNLRDKVEIRILDNGNGIPASVKAHIFDPFFTTKPTGEGTGLGLSLSYDIITKGHGGEITVETKEGEGTEMILILNRTKKNET